MMRNLHTMGAVLTAVDEGINRRGVGGINLHKVGINLHNARFGLRSTKALLVARQD